MLSWLRFLLVSPVVICTMYDGGVPAEVMVRLAVGDPPDLTHMFVLSGISGRF